MSDRIKYNRQLYQKISARTSRYVTHQYSTSFSLSIMLLHPDLRYPIRGIYAFVRLADELVDTFHQTDRAYQLSQLKEQTYHAIQNGFSSNPILHYFQKVVNDYKIDTGLVDAFYNSMEMDLKHSSFNRLTFDEYVHGSAEVVGLMCLHVFCEGDLQRYEELKNYALRLGAAYQKVNFLRDLNEDLEELDRAYFPQLGGRQLESTIKESIEKQIEDDFDAAYKGIFELPIKARYGVYVSYLYYRRLFQKIKRTPADKMMERRIRISNPRKVFILCQAYIHHTMKRFL